MSLTAYQRANGCWVSESTRILDGEYNRHVFYTAARLCDVTRPIADPGRKPDEIPVSEEAKASRMGDLMPLAMNDPWWWATDEELYEEDPDAYKVATDAELYEEEQ